MKSEIFEKFGEWRVCGSAEATRDAARELGALLPADCTLALHGGLGAGKTTFVGGLAEAFGVREAVTSPSYNIYAIYDGRSRQLIHMDAYRLPSPEAAEALMLEEFMRSPWCWVVEWPEKIGDALPPDALHLDFEILSAGTHRFRVRAR
ncbi:MAG: tRNA (adenosine(37)-N6)-threonylcarbamoyltransferase complex ATPase subunit type 1 TsaE [Candidatus Spyradosoma sp.]